jgi:tetratricopeptide (TPR) repeat protein
LVDCSLLRRGTDGRYELHPLLRQFTGERLQQRFDVARQMQQNHAQWYGEWLHSYLPGLSGNRQSAALAAVEAETENVRTGWHWGGSVLSPSLIERFTPALFHFYNLRGWYREGAQLFEEAIAGLRAGAPTDGAMALAGLLIHLAQFYHRLSRLDAAQALLLEAMPLVRAQNRPGELGFALNALGLNAYMRGEYGEAQTPLEEALAHFRQVNEPAGIASVLNNLGNLVAAVDTDQNYAAARSFYAEAIGVARSTDNLLELARGLINLGTVEHVGHRYALAQAYYQEGISAGAAIGNRRLQAIGLTNLGEILVQTHDLPGAQQVLEQALALKQSLGDARGLVHTLNVLAGIEKELGNREAARGRWIEAVRSGLSAQALSPALDASLELAHLLAEDATTGSREAMQAVQLAEAILLESAAEAHIRREAKSLLDKLTVHLSGEERQRLAVQVQARGLAWLLDNISSD